jgi:NADH-quinone oxidoreductase E subunit
VENCCCGESKLSGILARYQGQDGALIKALQDAQGLYGYLPEEVLARIADYFDHPYSQVYGVATFYAQFRLKPRGENLIRVCTGTVCHIMGGPQVLAKISEELNISLGETTEDNKFTLGSAVCFGACSQAPVIMVNDDIYGRVTPERIAAILARYCTGV